MTITELAEKSSSIRNTYYVTPEVYYSFQRCSNDYNPLHTDPLFSSDKGFSGIVMYGNILNAFISHFVGMLLPSREVMILAQDISFRKPVYLNDEISLNAEVEKFSEMANIISYKLKFVRNHVGEQETVARGHVQIGILNNQRV